ncbi:MAG: hypothetical protein JWO02_729 [Solirubrobacterales bacterium]|nr:hypothetical protein [Solirubrobacterales bacterium]
MSDWRIDEQQLLQLNSHLQRTDDVLIHNCLTRTAQESKLFPIMPYLMMCFYDAYYRFPDLLREATSIMSPEDMGRRAREVVCGATQVTTWGTLNFYLNGRTNLIRAGLLRPEDNLEDLCFMVDYHHRFMRSYHRSSAQVWALDSGDIAQSHEERQLQVFEADAFEADSALRSAAAKFTAAGTQYSFLVHCESRVGLQASGPYGLGERRLMHTRDFTKLAECDFSWLDGVADGVTYDNLSLVLITDGAGIEISDFGTAYSSPEAYQDKITGVGLYTSDFLCDRYVPVGMDSAKQLTETLLQLTEELKVATRRLYSRFSEMTNDQMVEAGIYVYFQAASIGTHLAGTYRQKDWEFIDERTRRFWPVFNEEYSLDAYVDNFAALLGENAADTDYYLHPVSYGVWRRGGAKGPMPTPGRNASLVPSHVLDSHDYSLRVNANGLADARGTSSLPAKSTPYTFVQGKLSEDEMNAAARAWSSPLAQSPWKHIDERTVKFHWQEPEVDALYRYSQERSRLLAGRGASLRRADIDRIRREAGERAWSEVTVEARAEVAA